MQNSIVLNPKFYYYFHPTQMNKKKKRVEHPNKVVKITKSPRIKPIKRSTISEKIDESLLISSELLTKFPILGPDFCQIDALDLAPRLLGKHLKKDDVILRITEVIISLKFSCFINNIIDLRLIMSLLCVCVCERKRLKLIGQMTQLAMVDLGLLQELPLLWVNIIHFPSLSSSALHISFLLFENWAWHIRILILCRGKLGKSCWGMRMFGLKSRIYYTNPMMITLEIFMSYKLLVWLVGSSEYKHFFLRCQLVEYNMHEAVM